MAVRKIKPVRDINTGHENEIQFDSFIGKPSERLLNLILDHQQKNRCENCKWSFAIAGYDKFLEIKEFNKPCLLVIHTELYPIQITLKTLAEKFLFLENTTFKSETKAFYGALLVYCEPTN